MARKHIDPDAWSVYDYETGLPVQPPGSPSVDLIYQSTNEPTGTGAICAMYDANEARWDYVRDDDRDRYERMGETVLVVYTLED